MTGKLVPKYQRKRLLKTVNNSKNYMTDIPNDNSAYVNSLKPKKKHFNFNKKTFTKKRKTI